jgi:uncharacterized protein involved in exopolysaccharide biosynthesis
MLHRAVMILVIVAGMLPAQTGREDRDKLDGLGKQLESLSLTYGANHPEIRRVESLIAQEKRTLPGIAGFPNEANADRLNVLRRDLTSAQAVYGERHPEIVRLRLLIRQVEDAMRAGH